MKFYQNVENTVGFKKIFKFNAVGSDHEQQNYGVSRQHQQSLYSLTIRVDHDRVTV